MSDETPIERLNDYLRSSQRDPIAIGVERELSRGTFLRELADRVAGVVRDVRLAEEREAARRAGGEPCVRQPALGEIAGRPCPDCGHVYLLHPGPGNPTVESCLVCLVDGLRRSMAAALGESR